MATAFDLLSGPNMNKHKISWEETTNARYTVTFQVHGSDTNYHSYQAVDWLGLEVGDSLDDYIPGVFSDALCHDIDADKKDQVTTITAEFYPSENDEVNPLLRDTTWSGGFQEAERVVDFDINNNPVLNTAGYPLNEPPLTIKAEYPTAKATKFFASIPWDIMNTLANTVNSDTFQGANPGTLTCKPSWKQHYDAFLQGTCYEVEFEFVYNPLGWTPAKIPSLGSRDKNGKQKFDGEGNPVDEISLLDSGGNFTTTPYSLSFDVLNSISYGALGL